MNNSTEELKNSNDLIERQAAVDALKDWYDGLIVSSFRGVEKVIKALPSTHCDNCPYPSQYVPQEDAVSRKDVVLLFMQLWDLRHSKGLSDVADFDEWTDICKTTANELPSVQPTSTNAPNTLEPLDCVDRKAVLQRLTDISYNHCKTQGEAEVIGLAKTMVSVMPSAQPEPIWGLPVSADRPLADREIVSRLRDIQRQVGGSYAIDRAIEIIDAVAERRTDEPDK